MKLRSCGNLANLWVCIWQALPARSPENGAQESARNDPDHADCRVVFKNADRDRAQLVAQLKGQRQEASEAARHFGVEKARYQAQLRKLTSENNELKQKNVDLQKRFDESTPDQGAYVRREEHEQILDELGKLSSSVTRTIGSRKSQSENVYQTTALPPSDVLQSPWVQPAQFDMLENPVVPDDIAPMLSTSEALALPDFDTYGEMS